eukprot:7809009-Alexandrium_andersonii.AAC.1
MQFEISLTASSSFGALPGGFGRARPLASKACARPTHEAAPAPGGGTRPEVSAAGTQDGSCRTAFENLHSGNPSSRVG